MDVKLNQGRLVKKSMRYFSPTLRSGHFFYLRTSGVDVFEIGAKVVEMPNVAEGKGVILQQHGITRVNGVELTEFAVNDPLPEFGYLVGRG